MATERAALGQPLACMVAFEEAVEPAYGGGTEVFHRAVFRFEHGPTWTAIEVPGPWMRTKQRALKAHPNGAALPDAVARELYEDAL